MKLERRQPDQPGDWWCWSEGMKSAKVLEIKMSDAGPMYYYEGPLSRGPEHVSASGYTHFAGPIPQPELPEPERHETKGAVMSIDDSGRSARVFFDEPIPGSLVGGRMNVPLKITLEKVSP